MTIFTARVGMKGQNGKVVNKIYDLGDFTTGTPAGDYAAAEIAITQITGALATVTDATLSQVTLTAVVSTDVAAGGGDVFENALINAFLDAAGEKTTQTYIPAPAQAIFLAVDGVNRDVVDTGDADLIQYIQQLEQHAFVSDGEQINVTVNNGMKNGVRVVRNLKLGV
jgi:hypothetical protein